MGKGAEKGSNGGYTHVDGDHQAALQARVLVVFLVSKNGSWNEAVEEYFEYSGTFTRNEDG